MHHTLTTTMPVPQRARRFGAALLNMRCSHLTSTLISVDSATTFLVISALLAAGTIKNAVGAASSWAPTFVDDIVPFSTSRPPEQQSSVGNNLNTRRPGINDGFGAQVSWLALARLASNARTHIYATMMCVALPGLLSSARRQRQAALPRTYQGSQAGRGSVEILPGDRGTCRPGGGDPHTPLCYGVSPCVSWLVGGRVHRRR